MTRLSALQSDAVASLCIARTKADAARREARTQYDRMTAPQDRYAALALVQSLGSVVDRLDVALAVATDAVDLVDCPEDCPAVQGTGGCACPPPFAQVDSFHASLNTALIGAPRWAEL